MKIEDVKTDCRSFVGEKPCRPGKECVECSDYSPMGRRILIIKIAAGGDVLRTVSLLEGLKKAHEPCFITWITQKSNVPLLANHPLIDILYPLDGITARIVCSQVYDIVINLEKTADCTALAENVAAPVKLGFGMNLMGTLRPLTREAEYAYKLGLSDELKFRKNTKTYPEIIYDICRLTYAGERYKIFLSGEQQKNAADLRKKYTREHSCVIGLNTGSGPVFATKKWPVERWLGLIEVLYAANFAELVLLGGPDEAQRNRHIMTKCPNRVRTTGNDNSLEDFIGIVGAMDIIVTADTLAMHIALALQKQVVVLLGPTSIIEIDLFGHGEKIFSDFDCMPCYKKSCEQKPNCMEAIGVSRVFESIQRIYSAL